MQRLDHYVIILILTTLVAGCLDDAPETPPNVVVILIDDLGWIDTGVYGSAFYETPNIDRLATEGMRFTQFYTASSVCSPTRASLMTGKHPARLHLTNWIGGEQKGPLLQADYIRQLPLEETTLGEAFQEAGYATGYIGKWHLGKEGFMPGDQGFAFTRTVNYAGQPGSYFPPYENPNFALTNVPDLNGDPGDAYLTDRLTDVAVEFLETRRDSPFLLVLSHYAVHTPLQSKDTLTHKYEAKAETLPPTDEPAFRPEGTLGITKQRQDHAVYAGMIESTDESVGRVLDALDTLNLADNTIVIFVSDNGGLSTLNGDRDWAPTSNRPLRAGKGLLYEGGIRVPFIVKAPGVTQPGSLAHTPATSTDLYPTLLTLAGLPLRPDQHRDGINLTPLFTGADALARDTLYWHFPHYHGSGNRPTGAIRAGAFKLIEWFEDDRIELFNLDDDLGETTDLAATMPGKAAELRDALLAWRETVDARMPTPNPEWVADRDDR